MRFFLNCRAVAASPRWCVMALLTFWSDNSGMGQDVPPAPVRADVAESAGECTVARRIGDWEISRWPGLTIAVDPRGEWIHLVFRDGNRLFYTRSVDGGKRWNKPALIAESAMHPRMVLDHKQTLHLVYCTGRERFPGDRMPKDGCYTSLTDDRWSLPVQLNRPDEGAFDVRVATDGADNVHILYWGTRTAGGELGDHDNQRCYYRRKAAGVADFEAPLCLENPAAPGPSSHGALAVGPEGEVHVLYRTFQTTPTWTGNLEHRVRGKDGVWRGPPEVYPGVYLTDYALAALVDAERTLHLACYTMRPHGFQFKYLRKPADGALQEVFAEDEIYGTSTDILQTPNGDLWLTGSGNWSTRSRVGAPRSSCYHYDPSAANGWQKQLLAAEGGVNVDTFCEGPKLVRYRDQVQVFYAEKRLGEERFRLYQKLLTKNQE